MTFFTGFVVEDSLYIDVLVGVGLHPFVWHGY